MATPRSGWTIHIETIDGEKATLQLQQDIFDRPVAELVEAACQEIGNDTCRVYSHKNALILFFSLVCPHACLKGSSYILIILLMLVQADELVTDHETIL